MLLRINFFGRRNKKIDYVNRMYFICMPVIYAPFPGESPTFPRRGQVIVK